MNAKDHRKPSPSRATYDLVVIMIATLVILSLASAYDLYETFNELVKQHEVWNPNELVIALMFLGLSLVVFAVRRSHELRHEVVEREQAEAALRQSEAHYRLLFTGNPMPMWVYDVGTLRFLDVNDAAVAHYGYSRSEVLGMTIKDIRPPEDWPRVEAHLAAHSEPQRVSRGFRHLKKNGAVIDVDVLSNELDFHGRAARLVLANDVTERKQAEAQLRLQSAAMEAAANAIMITDVAGNITWVNPAFTRLTGYGLEEVQGQTPRLLKSDQQDPAFYKRLWDTILAGQVWHDEVVNRRKDGSLYDEDMTVTPVRDERGAITHFIDVQQDITERKRAEEALRVEKERFQWFVDANIVGIVIADATGKLMAVNDYYLRVLGASRQDFLDGKVDWRRFTPPEWLPVDEKALQELREHGICEPYEKQYLRADGTRVDVYLVDALLPGPGEQIAAFVLDITKRKRAEAALRQSEERFRRYFQLGLIGMAMTSPTKGLIEVNDEMCAIFGYERSEMLQMQWPQLSHPDDLAPDIAKFDRIMAGEIDGYTGDKRWIRKDGQVIDGTLAVKCLRLPDGSVDYFVVLLQDVTARKRAETALQASERRFRVLIENSADAITLIDRVGTVVYDSPAAPRMLGYAPGEMIGRNAFDLVHPDDVGPSQALLNRLLQEPGERIGHTFRLRHKDGSWRWIEAVASNLLAEPSVGAVVINYRDFTGRREAEVRLQRQFDRLAALRAVDTAITASLDVRLTLNVVLEQVTSQLNVDAADMLLFQPQTQTLEYAAGRGFRTAALHNTRLSLGQGHASRAVRERRTIHVRDVRVTGFLRSPLFAPEGFIAYHAVPLLAKAQVVGVLEIFHRRRFEPDPEWLDFLDSLARQAAIAIDNARLFDQLQRANAELTAAYDATIEGWSRALDLRDKETEGHTQRVTEIALRLAQVFDLGEAELVHVRRGALLHDIGKLGVPDHILLKPGALTDAEWDVMRQHPVFAYEMLSPIVYLRPALDIPLYHHEKWDGTGYPRGLAGELIPLVARIFAIVDVWDALRSDRPYRAGWPVEKVRQHIREQAGAHFDPRVVEAFLQLDLDAIELVP